MGELLAGAALRCRRPGLPRRSTPDYRAGLGWFGLFAGRPWRSLALRRRRPRSRARRCCCRCSATVLVLDRRRRRRGSPSGRSPPCATPRRSGSATARTRSTSGTGRRSCSSTARYGPLSLAQRLAVVALVGRPALPPPPHTSRIPVRHLRWLAVRPARGLALGGALCSLALGRRRTGAGHGPECSTPGRSPRPPCSPSRPPDPATGTTTVVPTTATPGAAPTATTAPASATPVTLDALDGERPLGPGGGEPAGARTGPRHRRRAVQPESVARPGRRRPGRRSTPTAASTSASTPTCTPAVDSCRYGSPDAPVRVVLFGDSHAAQWFPALREIVEDRGDQLIVLTKGGCPTAAVSIPTATLARTCPQWRDAAVALLAAERPDVVIVSGWSGYPEHRRRVGAGLRRHAVAPCAAHRTLIVLGDNPPAQDDPAGCLSGHLRSAEACVADRADVVAASRIDVERRVAGSLRRDVRRHHRLAVHRQQVPGDDRQPAAVPRHDPPDHVRHAVVRAVARREHAVVTTWS